MAFFREMTADLGARLYYLFVETTHMHNGSALGSQVN